jgi:hypothetical protein
MNSDNLKMTSVKNFVGNFFVVKYGCQQPFYRRN